MRQLGGLPVGSIGVRCARSHLYLYLRIEAIFAKDHLQPDFRTDGRDRKLNALLKLKQPWDGLTPLGKQITDRVLKIKRFGFKQVRTLSARPHYFCVEVYQERAWIHVLPAVVAIIREETNDPTAPVYAFDEDQKIEQWHVPLLDQLF